MKKLTILRSKDENDNFNGGDAVNVRKVGDISLQCYNSNDDDNLITYLIMALCCSIVVSTTRWLLTLTSAFKKRAGSLHFYPKR